MTSIFAPEHRQASVATFTAMSMLAFEGTAVIAALPVLAEQLGDVHLLPWVITGFLLASGVATVATGPLVDSFGVRPVFVVAALAMAATGGLAGLADSMPALVGLRVAQGAAAGGLITATNAGVNVSFPARLAPKVFAGNSTVWGVVGGAAPAIASAMLAYLSWRWIFYITLPIGTMAAWLAWRSMPSAQPGAQRHPVDWTGLGLVTVFSIGSVLAISELNVGSLVLAGLALASLAGFVSWSRRKGDRAVMRLEDFAHQPFFGIAMGPTLLLAGSFCAHLYLTVYLSAGRGFSQSAAAWSVLWFTIGWTLGSNVAARILDRLTPIRVMTAGWASSTTGLAVALVAVLTTAPTGVIFAAMTVVGLGAGLSTNAGLVAIKQVAVANEMGRKAAAHYFLRSQGFTLGSAAGGSALLFVITSEVGQVEPVRELLSDASAGEINLPDGVTTAQLVDLVGQGYAVAVTVGLIVCALSILPLRALKSAGLTPSGR